jgi:hypothetical protein
VKAAPLPGSLSTPPFRHTLPHSVPKQIPVRIGGGAPILACTTTPKVSAENCGTLTIASGSFRVRWPYSNYRMLGDFAGFVYVIISPTRTKGTRACRGG